MDDSLKQRLIGAIILIALAVIFIPVFFDRDRIEPLDHQTQIPIAPIVEDIKIAKPVNNVKVDRAKPPKFLFSPKQAVKETAKQVVDNTTTKTIKKPIKVTTKKMPKAAIKGNVKNTVVPSKIVSKITPKKKEKMATDKATGKTIKKDSSIIPDGWVLQVASFAEKDLAKKLQKKLNKDGYNAYAETVPTPNGSRSRIFIGPKLEKTKIEKIQKVVEKKYALKGLVLRFGG